MVNMMMMTKWVNYIFVGTSLYILGARGSYKYHNYVNIIVVDDNSDDDIC